MQITDLLKCLSMAGTKWKAVLAAPRLGSPSGTSTCPPGAAIRPLTTGKACDNLGVAVQGGVLVDDLYNR